MLVESPELAALPGIRHAFFTREGGVSSGIYASLNGGIGSSDDQAHVRENRRRMAEKLGVAPQNLAGLYQIHSADALVVTEALADGQRPRADGMATRVPGLALGISTADCGPVLFADPENRVIGACHAAWKGALGGVLEATLAAMESLGAERARTVAVLGPTIGREAYEVGLDFRDRFTDQDADNARYFRAGARDDRAMFDLPAYIVARLGGLGLLAVADLALCTYSDGARFFSYRRTTHRAEPDYGRQISAIALAP